MSRLVYIEIDSTIQLVVKNWDGAKGVVVNGNWVLTKSEFTHQYRSDDHKWKVYKTFEVTKVPSWLRNEDYNEIIEKMIEYKNEINSEQTNTKTEYFKRIDEIRKGLREDERPSYFELTAWITSMKGQENLKAILRRVACIARIKGISFEQVEQCVNSVSYTHLTLPTKA